MSFARPRQLNQSRRSASLLNLSGSRGMNNTMDTVASYTFRSGTSRFEFHRPDINATPQILDGRMSKHIGPQHRANWITLMARSAAGTQPSLGNRPRSPGKQREDESFRVLRPALKINTDTDNRDVIRAKKLATFTPVSYFGLGMAAVTAKSSWGNTITNCERKHNAGQYKSNISMGYTNGEEREDAASRMAKARAPASYEAYQKHIPNPQDSQNPPNFQSHSKRMKNLKDFTSGIKDLPGSLTSRTKPDNIDIWTQKLEREPDFTVTRNTATTVEKIDRGLVCNEKRRGAMLYHKGAEHNTTIDRPYSGKKRFDNNENAIFGYKRVKNEKEIFGTHKKPTGKNMFKSQITTLA